MSLYRDILLVLVLLHAGSALGATENHPLIEQLEYEASYRGLLTADNKIAIAKVSLQTRKVVLPAFPEPLLETSLGVSSEIFPFVEENYRFRVRIRSLYQAESFALLAREKYKLTDDSKHEITWVDRKSGEVGRYRTQGSGPELPAVLGNWVSTDKPFRFYKPAKHKLVNGLVDWLSMLQSLRQKQVTLGAEYRFPVTDGKRLLEYRVEVQGEEQIQVAGKQQQAWKLVFNALYTKKGVTSQYHAPVHLWLSKDPAALPLRFVEHHALGTFTVELKESSE